NCRVGAARAGHRAWWHNRDERSVVGELLAHCDRHLGTATASAATPRGGTATAGTRRRGTPSAGTPPFGNSGVGTPRGGSAAASSASSATAAGGKVRRPGDHCVDYQ